MEDVENNEELQLDQHVPNVGSVIAVTCMSCGDRMTKDDYVLVPVLAPDDPDDDGSVGYSIKGLVPFHRRCYDRELRDHAKPIRMTEEHIPQTWTRGRWVSNAIVLYTEGACPVVSWMLGPGDKL